MTKTMNNRKISILGAGVSGLALAELAVSHGAKVFVSDAKEISKESEQFFSTHGITWEASGNTEKVLDADEIVIIAV